jgi:Cep192 domain 4
MINRTRSSIDSVLIFRRSLVLMALLLLYSVSWGANNNPLLVGGPHALPKRPQGLITQSTAPPGAQLTYYGGRVVSNMQVYMLLWGNGGAGGGDGQYLPQVRNPLTPPSMASFYFGVLNSAYVDWLSEYNTNIIDFGGGPGTNQRIGHGTVEGGSVLTPSDTSNPIDDSAIQVELVNLIASGRIPAPTTDAEGNNNTYYAIFFPHGQFITMGGNVSCLDFCAYHGTIASAQVGEIYYGVHPDMQAGSGCDLGCGDGATPFDNYTSVASHEMVETITDPEVGLASFLAPPLAWYDSVNGEIGDICNQQQGSIIGADGRRYTVQKEFSNAANDCIVSAAAPPPTPTPTPAPTPVPEFLKTKPRQKNFGNVTVGHSKVVTFTLSNTASSGPPITFASPIAFTVTATNPRDFGFPAGATTCPQNLLPKEKCKLKVEFAPQARGFTTSTLTIFDNAAGAPQTVPLSGSGR